MATEKRLIDANEIEELYYKQVEYGATDLMDAFDDALQDALTVDAVEVVRCMDCKFSKPPSAQVQKYGVPGSLRCENRNSPSNHRLVFGDGYCPYGERKDND